MRALRIAAAAAIALLLGAGPAAGDARQAYRDGQNAIEDGRFDDAESLFRRAITERPEEKVGGFRRDYLPYYYLGVALAEQNRCREALAAWVESERQGQVMKAEEEAAELARRKEQCGDRVRGLDAARSAAEQAVARARRAEQALERLHGAPELEAVWSRGDPSYESREKAARKRLAEAATRLETAPPGEDATPFQEAKNLANQAADDLDELMTEAQTRLSEIRDAASSALGRLEAAEGRARAELGNTSYLEPLPPRLASRARELKEALDEVVGEKATAGPRDLDLLRKTLNDSIVRLREAAQGPPESLQKAAEAFLAGGYDDVVATLEGESFADPRAAGHACLLLAAARHALYLLGGEQDAELAAALYRDVTGCRELGPRPRIDAAAFEKYFSPRFVAYWDDPTEPEPPPAGAGAETEPAPEGTEPAPQGTESLGTEELP